VLTSNTYLSVTIKLMGKELTLSHLWRIVMKSTLQKCYEKMSMIKHNPDQLRLMAGKFDSGEAAVILVLDKDGNGINVTPVAIMLDQERINSLNPDWIYSKKIYKVIEDATRIDKRTKVGDFAGQFIMIDELFDKADF
jgi:hypothetical protein